MFQILLIDERDDEPNVLYNIQDFTCMSLSFDSVTKIVDLFFTLKQIDAMDVLKNDEKMMDDEAR